LIFLISNPFTTILYNALVWLNDFVSRFELPPSISSYAIAIILIAIIVRVVTYPLTAAQQRSMRAMQELQPKIKALEAQYPDRDERSKAQMELFRENGVSPLNFGGCLPLVIQMVVLFGLYRAISMLAEEGELTGQRFLWIPDLAHCEPSPTCLPETSLLPIAIPIMIILLVVTQLIYQKFLTPPATDSQTQAMTSAMKWMPLAFAFIFISLPAGLVLYYTTTNIASIAQYLAIDRHKMAPKPPPSDTETPALTDEASGAGGKAALTNKDTSNDDVDSRRQRRRKKRN
jgi:YidC/Oxa1 family membrane protein insertase